MPSRPDMESVLFPEDPLYFTPHTHGCKRGAFNPALPVQPIGNGSDAIPTPVKTMKFAVQERAQEQLATMPMPFCVQAGDEEEEWTVVAYMQSIRVLHWQWICLSMVFTCKSKKCMH
jgi:hypothetical protein